MAGRSAIKLELQVDNASQTERFEQILTAETPLILGRGATATVLIKSTSVGREHCKLHLRENAVWAEDLGSSNGTFYYGQKIEGQKRLADGDILTLGPVTVKITELAPARVEERKTFPAGASGFVRQGNPPANSPPQSPQPVKMQPWQTTMAVPDMAALQASTDKVQIALDKPELTIGSSPDCDVVLSHVMISRKHARIRRLGQVWFVEDLGSTNGTYVNGQRLRSKYGLDVGDTVKIGPHELKLDGNFLTTRSLEKEGVSIMAHQLTKDVVNRRTGQTARLLEGVSLTIKPGEFIGLLGPSGCGKSTLMDALNGRRPTNAGFVYYNTDDLYQAFESYKGGIGYVPQDVIFHKPLTVNEALRYISRLRLPTDTTTAQIEENVKRVLGMVGLSERADTVISNLSGGQKKRVSLAIELISRPTILFLDEVTSGLDVASEREVMDLMRRLADDGLTIICITHFVDSLDRCDKLACLMRGRLVFYGSPNNFRTHFGVRANSEVYSLEKQRSPEQWEQHFRSSIYYAPPVPPDAGSASKIRGVRWVDADRFRTQVVTLTSRYFRLMTADRTMPLVLMALAPVIAILLCLVTKSIDYDIDVRHRIDDLYNFKLAQSVLSFGAVLAVMFLSMFGSVQEVVKESRIYRHERSNNLMIIPYMISKLIPLSIVGAIQCASVVLVLNMFGHLRAGNMLSEMLLLVGTSWVGTLLGLVISTAVPTGNQGGEEESGATLAVTLMNAIVIPELLFAGALSPLAGVSLLIARSCITAYWGYQGFVTDVNVTLGQKLGSSHAIPGFELINSDTPGYTKCLTMLALHWAVACVLWFAILLRKDGSDAFKRLYRALPRDVSGKISSQQILADTGKILGVKQR